MLEQLIEIDKELFLYLNGLHKPFLNQLMFYISEKWIWVPLYAFFVYLMWTRYRKHFWITLIGAAVLVTLSDQIHLHLFKNAFERLRPTYDPAIQHMVHTVNNYRGGQYGFVSGHATNSFAVATFVSVLLAGKYKWLTPLVLFWAALVSYSRIYLGVHFPGDILGGMLLGSFLGILIGVICKIILVKKTSS
ncbi:MAG: phosphatase PAP2 family protein [Bacteroidales bacterium]|nr:phosphatase PAP2 family protein [Bacteroidales bacterium]MCF8344751.1 phosphatase PAP2 family protein [Bacteroidales bacterium]MCF8377338.1 phosphatase PAP2 family protein [Bacteroidales bacterium]MCF8401916.1 phosphatase PAP2 family protein [Bacteroidales bacterium]